MNIQYVHVCVFAKDGGVIGGGMNESRGGSDFSITVLTGTPHCEMLSELSGVPEHGVCSQVLYSYGMYSMSV